MTSSGSSNGKLSTRLCGNRVSVSFISHAGFILVQQNSFSTGVEIFISHPYMQAPVPCNNKELSLTAALLTLVNSLLEPSYCFSMCDNIVTDDTYSRPSVALS